MKPVLLGSLDSANRYAWTREAREKKEIKKTVYISSYSILPVMLACQKTVFGVFLGAFEKIAKSGLSVRPFV
jgi:hypothetical protein